MPASPGAEIIGELAQVLGRGNVLDEIEDLVPFSFDGTAGLKQLPAAVVFPRTTAHVAACVRAAAARAVPIVTRGSGTGLSGGSVPTPGSVVLCLARMNEIREVDAGNLTVRAQAGAVTLSIDEAAARHGLFYPPDPGSMRVSTIGGNVAENSGGLRGLKYGVTRDYVMQLEVVLADGQVARFGSQCVKDVAGYSMKDLFIGSEGTLGIVTEVTLKLVPRPAARRTMLALYDRIEDAAETVSAIIADRIVPCTLEFIDRMTARCVEDYARIGLPTDCAAILLMETDGHPAAVADEAGRMADIAAAHGARELARHVILNGLFLNPRALRWFGRVLRIYQRSGLETVVRRLGVLRALPSALRRLDRLAPRIGTAFSNQLIAAHEEPRGLGGTKARWRVAVLTGCVQDLVFAQVNRDTVDVLLANGCAVDTPPVQPCCGSLHAHNGERDTARLLARRLIDLLPPDDYDAIISNAGGCGSHLRRLGLLLADDPHYAPRARAWDRKLRDVHEWLAQITWRVPSASPRPEAITLTYHDSCHLTHAQKVTSQPRSILRSLPGVSLVELKEASWCCGAAGVYAVTQPAQADSLLERKVGHVRATAAGVVATANPGCHLQIERGLTEGNLPISVVHPVSLLAAAYHRESTGGVS